MADVKEDKDLKSLKENPWYMRTTCHGISDIFLATSTIERGFWLICVVVSFIFVCPALLYMITNYAVQNEWISTTYEEKHDEVYLPKIVLCNYNRVNQTKADLKYHLNSTHLLYINKQFHNTAYVFNNSLENLTMESEIKQYVEWRSSPYGKNISFEELLNDLTADCEVTIHFLVYSDKLIADPCTLVTKMSNTHFGRCLLLEIPKTFGPITLPGQMQSLKLILDSKLEDYETGVVKQFLQHGFAMYMFYDAHPDHWVSLAPGFHHMISIRAEKSFVTTYQFNSFSFFRRSSKKCMQEKEFLVLDYNTKYTKVACQIDCALYTIASQCNCIPLKSIAKYSACEPDHLDICLREMAASLNVTFDKVTTVASSACMRKCENLCIGRKIKYEISASNFLAQTKIPELQKMLKAIGSISANSSFLTKNFLGVDIFYDTLSVFTVEWRERMSIEQLISNIGGQLGFCAGISFLTITQAVYYMCVFLKNILFCKRKHLRKVENFETESKNDSNDCDEIKNEAE